MNVTSQSAARAPSSSSTVAPAQLQPSTAVPAPAKAKRKSTPRRQAGDAGAPDASSLASNPPASRTDNTHWRGGSSARGSGPGFGPGFVGGAFRGGAHRGASSSPTPSRGGGSSRGVSDFAIRAGRGALQRDQAATDDLGRRLDGLQVTPAALPGRPAAAPHHQPDHGPRRAPRRAPRAPNPAEDDEPSSADESGPLLKRITLAPDETGGLSAEILKLYKTQRATPAALAARDDLIRQLNRLLNNERFRWGHQHSPHANPIVVEPFGSVRFGLSTSSSDLDLCIFDPYRPNGFDSKFFRTKTGAAEELPTIYDMRDVGRRLQHYGFKDVRSVPFAAVPIVKFKAVLGKEVIEVDINTNERLGVLNSRLINAYCDLHPIVRPLCVFIKFWARQRELNDPGGVKGPVTFSSYTLILLVIAYLQQYEVLPNLQDSFLIASTATARQRFWSRPRQSRKGKKVTVQASMGWDVTFLEKIPAGLNWTVVAGLELAALAEGFFRYYTADFDPVRQIVSIQHGAPMDRVHPFVAKPDPPLKPSPAAAPATDAAEPTEGHAAQSPTATPASGDESASTTAAEELDSMASAEASESVATEPEPVVASRPAHTPPKGPFGSRSSSPVGYEGFEEPSAWVQKLVVQDPFILTRNTALNVEPWVADELHKEMTRALRLIESNAPIAEICASIKNEPDYKSLSNRRREERNKRGLRNSNEKAKLAQVIRKGEPQPPRVVNAVAVASCTGDAATETVEETTELARGQAGPEERQGEAAIEQDHEGRKDHLKEI